MLTCPSPASAASTPGVHKLVLRELLVPRQWKPPEDRKFTLDAEQINELCETAERILREEPSVLRLTGALFNRTSSHCCCSWETANAHSRLHYSSARHAGARLTTNIQHGPALPT